MLVQGKPGCVWSKIYVPVDVYVVPFQVYSSQAVSKYEESSCCDIVRWRVSTLVQVEPCCVWSKVYVPVVVYVMPFHEYSSQAVT